jgi:3-oxoacyl-[acyl-carrier protein] reductase
MSESGASECQSSATSPDLTGKLAVVTGGSRELGAATAMDLVANGVSVAVTTELTSRFDA